jgi:hypothetical protein
MKPQEEFNFAVTALAEILRERLAAKSFHQMDAAREDFIVEVCSQITIKERELRGIK